MQRLALALAVLTLLECATPAAPGLTKGPAPIGPGIIAPSGIRIISVPGGGTGGGGGQPPTIRLTNPGGTGGTGGGGGEPPTVRVGGIGGSGAVLTAKTAQAPLTSGTTSSSTQGGI